MASRGGVLSPNEHEVSHVLLRLWGKAYWSIDIEAVEGPWYSKYENQRVCCCQRPHLEDDAQGDMLCI